MGAAKRHLESLIVLSFLLLACSCGGEDAGGPAASQTPAPVVETTPDPTPEPTRLELAPVTLFLLVLDEETGAPELPSRSPLARDLGPLPEGIPDADLLAVDGAPSAVVEALRSLEAGYGAPGSALVLVRWDLRWGPDGAAGSARRWGLCSLPCTVEDRFTATPDNHPVHPMSAPRALFAMRPGVEDLRIRLDEGGIEVAHGEAILWLAGEAGDPVIASRQDTWPEMDAGGLLSGEVTASSGRVLQVLAVDSRTIELTGTSDPLPVETRVLPTLGVSPSTVGRLVVEGVEEVWSWPGGASFEGGFSARPNPDNDGLRLDRIKQEIRWRPTVRQAGDGRADFPTYSLAGASNKLTVQPFPEGGAVLGGTPVADGRVVVGAGTDFEPERRAHQVADMLDHFAGILPLPEAPADEALEVVSSASKAAPWVIYVAPEDVGVLPGSAGSRPLSLTVDDDLDERDSVARAWARLQLAPRIDARSPAALDFLDWALAKLDEDRPDRSVFMHAFVEAGDDVEQVWREWLTDPEREEPTPAAFVAFVAGQLPDLAEQLRRALVARRFAVEVLPEPMELEPGAAVLSLTLEDPGAAGAVLALRLPPGAELEPVQVEVTTQSRGVEPHWAAALVEERYWVEAVADAAARAALPDRLGDTRGIAAEQEEEMTPPAAPSQLQGQYGGVRMRGKPKPRQAEPVGITLSHEGQPTGRSVALVMVWGAPGWKARLAITSAVPMPEPAVEAASPDEEPAPEPASEPPGSTEQGESP